MYFIKMFALMQEMGWPENNKSDYDQDIIQTWTIFTTLITQMVLNNVNQLVLGPNQEILEKLLTQMKFLSVQ